MRARKWGRIINLTSVAAQAGSVMAVHYSAAKAGVIAATKSYARLLAKEGVTVNAISPALIGTEMVASNPHVKPDMIPVGRFGRVEECADVAVLLAGNAYITGQTIGVNGGNVSRVIRLGSIPQPLRIADSSAALVAFLKRAPDCPFTRPSHSAHVT
jgi:3-oxoacyl-[acyl-carrier protein] reductase